jgi:tetratricopeptide (TPR) repeat protein
MFDRPRRRRRLKNSRHPELESDAANKPAPEPWVALALEELIQGAKGPQAEVDPPRSSPALPRPTNFPKALIIPISAAVCVLALFVCQSAIRTTLSDHWIADSSIPSLEKATSFVADNALGWFRLGVAQSKQGASESAEHSLRQAAALAPSDSSSRIALGLELERVGRPDDAERALLEAAEVDAGFGVRWTLANFYLRRDDWEAVWQWIHAAILADPTQLPVAAALGWRASADPTAILDKAIPDQPDTNRGYFAYLLDLGQLSATLQAWPRFSATLTSSETAIATQYIDRLINARLIDEATVAWNLLCDKVLLPHAPLGTARDRFLTNPYFLTAPSSLGFDWHTGDNRGIAWSRLPSSESRGAIEFRLSGAQESGISLLSQIMPAAPGEYLLEFEFATQGMPTRTGVGWIVRDAYSAEVLKGFEDLNNAEGFWDSSRVNYTVPEGTRAVILELYYRSGDVGVIRRGAVQLRNVELKRTTSDGVVIP